jgi:hypothetical protein
MKLLFNYILVLLVGCLLFSCGSSAEKQDEETVISDSTVKAVEKTKLSAQNVFNSLPDRKELLKLVAENKLDYDTEILNQPDNVKNYNTETFIALNLGVYGSDLSVAGVFEQTQESILFLKCVNSLSQKLGVNKAFDQSMFDRMDAQRDNKDSTLQIITIAFKQADEILKANNRPATSALIIAGVWIEGFYTSCQISKKTPSEGIVKAILQHKETLDNIIVLLGQSDLNKDQMFILNDLTTISGIMGEIISQKDIKYTYETIIPADEAVTRLRSKVISAL